jgi:flagellar hook assembly protein FlgD
MFSSGQQFEVTITDEAGTEVYRFSDGKFFTLALINKTLDPGEALKWQDEWDMTNKDGEKLTSGNYKAVIKILALSESDSEKIDDSELTATIEFTVK